MTVVAYTAWYFVPIDTEPLEGRAMTGQPPFMSSMAVDAGSSLAFQLSSTSDPLQIRVTTTGFSAEGRGEDAIAVYTADSVESGFSPVEISWERSQDGMNAVFLGTLPRVRAIVKLRVPTPPALVVTSVEFVTP